MLRRLLVLALLQGLAATAHACLFARAAQPDDWYEWASALFAADVTDVARDAAKGVDTISLRVAETFKGPSGAATATLRIPERLWAGCRLERPAVGAHVLTALNPNGDALIVPLSEDYAARLRSAAPR